MDETNYSTEQLENFKEDFKDYVEKGYNLLIESSLKSVTDEEEREKYEKLMETVEALYATVDEETVFKAKLEGLGKSFVNISQQL